MNRLSLTRALLAPCVACLILAGCAGGTTTRDTGTAGNARIPAVCKKYGSMQDQQECAGRWQVAQDECKREETDARKAGGKEAESFSLSKCISKKMNLAALGTRPAAAQPSSSSKPAEEAKSSSSKKR